MREIDLATDLQRLPELKQREQIFALKLDCPTGNGNEKTKPWDF